MNAISIALTSCKLDLRGTISIKVKVKKAQNSLINTYCLGKCQVQVNAFDFLLLYFSIWKNCTLTLSLNCVVL